MATTNPFENSGKPKGFWKKPEGVTGALFLIAAIAGIGFILATNLSAIMAFVSTVLGLVVTLLVLGAIIYMVLDPKMRALVGYMYKSVMRKITGMFVTIDPIGILKNYVDDLQDNLSKMSKQIGGLRGQMRKIKTLMQDNSKEIEQNMALARKAKEVGNQQQLTLSARKAARLKESNQKYGALHSKMTILHRVLTKMYANSEILLEDTKDQVKMKEQERKAIRASHGAMKSAMSIISGDSDKRAMFDQAMEHIADDVANKVGEMERFMEMSSTFMDSVDLQNGVFEDNGLKMLEEYEKQSSLLLMGGNEQLDDDVLDLGIPEEQYRAGSSNSDYEGLFD
ncbi:hypothetical protein [Portibacter lacus]|uniref:Uncharacterized protein n=1 Tax=Portibacter lacus TaxID=1099794 RepID=A0AA37WDV7_9BACT|nr:hypothetical protein [Portibacter lacus]GLR16064.1 hypothetical protein GCM10007940_06790 [Portibacter lacus]